MKNKKYHTEETFPKPNRKIIENSKIITNSKIVENGKIIEYSDIIENSKLNNPNTQIHDHSLSWLCTGTSIKFGRVKLVLWTQASPLLNIIL